MIYRNLVLLSLMLNSFVHSCDSCYEWLFPTTAENNPERDPGILPGGAATPEPARVPEPAHEPVPEPVPKLDDGIYFNICASLGISPDARCYPYNDLKALSSDSSLWEIIKFREFVKSNFNAAMVYEKGEYIGVTRDGTEFKIFSRGEIGPYMIFNLEKFLKDSGTVCIRFVPGDIKTKMDVKLDELCYPYNDLKELWIGIGRGMPKNTVRDFVRSDDHKFAIFRGLGQPLNIVRIKSKYGVRFEFFGISYDYGQFFIPNAILRSCPSIGIDQNTLRHEDQGVCIIAPKSCELGFVQLTKMVNLTLTDQTLGLIPKFDPNNPDVGGWVLEDEFIRAKYMHQQAIISKETKKSDSPSKYSDYAIMYIDGKGIFAQESQIHTSNGEDFVSGIKITNPNMISQFALNKGFVQKYKDKYVWTLRIGNNFYIKNKDSEGPLLAGTEDQILYCTEDEAEAGCIFIFKIKNLENRVVDMSSDTICYPVTVPEFELSPDYEPAGWFTDAKGSKTYTNYGQITFWGKYTERDPGVSLGNFYASKFTKALIIYNGEYVMIKKDKTDPNGIMKLSIPSLFSKSKTKDVCCADKCGKRVAIMLPKNIDLELGFPGGSFRFPAGFEFGSVPKYDGTNDDQTTWIYGDEIQNHYDRKFVSVSYMYKSYVPYHGTFTYVYFYDQDTQQMFEATVKSKDEKEGCFNELHVCYNFTGIQCEYGRNTCFPTECLESKESFDKIFDAHVKHVAQPGLCGGDSRLMGKTVLLVRNEKIARGLIVQYPDDAKVLLFNNKPDGPLFATDEADVDYLEYTGELKENIEKYAAHY